MNNRIVYFVKKNNVINLGVDQITIDLVGGKAFGLCHIPIVWSMPFFVISKELLDEYIIAPLTSTVEAYADGIKKALNILEIHGDIIIRSSAIDEGMQERGRFDSIATNTENFKNSLIVLLDKLKCIPNKGMPLIIQKYINPEFTGHMSNERRFSNDSRDWKIETYYNNNVYDQDTIGIRKWRTNYQIEEIIKVPLYCNSKNFSSELQKVGFYWHILSKTNKCRYHLEFVHDGKRCFVVQADCDYPNKNAINPNEYNIKINAPSKTWEPKVLKKFDPSGNTCFKKLNNVKIYHDLGFQTVPFYFLNDAEIFSELKEGVVREALKEDIQTLLQIQSIVIRMDINTKDQSKIQMLPRSNEMRVYNEIICWIKENVGIILEKNGDGVFIFHNFIPSISSAFVHVKPNGRLVKIQSLWGLPEGLYYNYHDTIIVDLGSTNIDSLKKEEVKVTVKNKYKDTFIYPDIEGVWVSKEVAPPNDWNCSIQSNDSIFDVAIKSQKIANLVGEEISVMWFIGIDEDYYGSYNMPWFHEKITLEASYTHDQYKRKYFSEEEIIINNSDELQKFISYGNLNRKKCFRLKPNCEKDLRNKELLKNIGDLAAKHDITILLDGTQLTHTYYQLKSTGANVVCSNTDELTYSDTLEFNKLVRDKIPEKIISNGEHVRCSIVSRPLLDRLLLEKLLEEAYEVYDANIKQDIESELADMREIIRTIYSLNNDVSISVTDVLNNKTIALYDVFNDFEFFKFNNDLTNYKSFRFGELYGYFDVRRQKTIYRIEFNLQNFPNNKPYKDKVDHETQFKNIKQKIIASISKALNCKDSKVLLHYLKTADKQIDILSSLIGTTRDDVCQKMLSKFVKNGGFEKGYVLKQTLLKDNIIDERKEFDPKDCYKIYTLPRDDNKYIEILQNFEKKQSRILCRFSAPIAVNSWEIVFESYKFNQLLPKVQKIKFEISKNAKGILTLTVKTYSSDKVEQLSIFDLMKNNFDNNSK